MESVLLGQLVGRVMSYQFPLRPDPPGNGNSLVVKLDGNYRYRLVACVFTLTTSGVAGNRFVTVEARRDDGRSYAVAGRGVVVTATTIQRFCGDLNRGSGESAAGTDIFFPLFAPFMDGGDTLRINIGGADAGDALSLIQMTFDRFLVSAGEHDGFLQPGA